MTNEKINLILKPYTYQQIEYKTGIHTCEKLIYIYGEPGPDKLLLKASVPIKYPWMTENPEKVYGLSPIHFDPFTINSKGQIEFEIMPKLNKSFMNSTESTGIFMDGDDWKFFGQKCDIIAKNLIINDLSISIEIKRIFIILKMIIEIPFIDILPIEIKTKYEFYKGLIDFDKVFSISDSERKSKNLNGDEFTYGEIVFQSFLPLLHFVANEMPVKPRVFWDLGCGSGKVLITAALTELFEKISGVEYLSGLANMAKLAIQEYEKNIHKLKIKQAIHFNIEEGDLEKYDWSDADIIYAASLCFPVQLLKAVSEKCKFLRKGARIMTLKMIPGVNEHLKLVHYFKIKMTWGLSDLFVLEKN